MSHNRRTFSLPDWRVFFRQPLLLIALAAMWQAGCKSETPSTPTARTPTIDELISAIDENPYESNFYYTPAVNQLIEIGDPAIPRVVDLMLSDNPETRKHAQTVLRETTKTKYGYVFGVGWSSEDHSKWVIFWESLGNLKWDQPLEERKKSVALWKHWISKQNP